MVQEDARSVIFDGSDIAKVHIFSNFPKDLRAYQEANSTLMLTIRVDKMPTDAVNLTMLCEDECSGTLDITPLLKAGKVNEWQEVSIDLACFIKAGVDFAKIMSPFTLSTQGKASLSFSDIHLAPQMAKQAHLSCSTGIN
jgi:beta-glucosidase